MTIAIKQELIPEDLLRLEEISVVERDKSTERPNSGIYNSLFDVMIGDEKLLVHRQAGGQNDIHDVYLAYSGEEDSGFEPVQVYAVVADPQQFIARLALFAKSLQA